MRSDMDRFFGLSRPAVIAHRGASRAARENTVEAFEQAVALGADAVELDVRRTADGAMVVHHDPEVGGAGVVATRSFAELRAAAPWVPTLEEAIVSCGRLWVNVEIKNLPVDSDWDPDETLATAVGALVVSASLEERVVLSSFNPASLAAARAVAPDVATAMLSVRGVDPLAGVDTAADAGHLAFHPAVESLAGDALAGVVEHAAARGVAVVPWTVDDPGEITRLARGGVSGIITNVPDIACAALAARP